MEQSVLIQSTHQVRLQLLRNLAKPQTRIVIVSPFLQDVEMSVSRTLLTFIEQQIRSRAEVELFTTPPSGKPPEFRRKFRLLKTFELAGAKIALNHKLHAKAFCFNHDDTLFATILGSTNITKSGLYENLELAFVSGRHGVYHSVLALVRIFMRDQETADFAVWQVKNSFAIKNALGASNDT